MIRSFLTLGTGEVIARALYVVAFLVLARTLGKTALGQFGFALTVTSYLVLAVQQGLDQIAVRTVSRDRSSLEIHIRGLFGLRLLIATALFALLSLYVALRHEGPLLLIFGLTCFSTALAPRWAFQILATRPLAISSIVSQVIFFCGVALVRGPRDLYLAAAFHVAGDIAATLYLLPALRPFCKAIAPMFAPRFWLATLRESWPLSISALFGIIVYNFDLLALGWLARPADLGLYLACYRCATVFSPVLSILQISILPAFSNAYSDLQKLTQAVRSVAIPALLVASAVTLLFTAFPAPILHLFYGPDYVQGSPILRILAWSLPLQAVRSILRQALLAAHLQRRDTLNMACAALTAICIDLFLIPTLGPLACAISTVTVEALLLVLSYLALNRTVFRPVR